MTTAVVVFTRDLRLHDNPALDAAVHDADRVVPLFVVDDPIRRSAFNRPNRARFLAESLADLDAGLHRIGGALAVRRGDVVAETVKLANEVDAAAVHMAADYSAYATRREDRLRRALGRRQLHLYDSHVVVPPGDLLPSGGADHFAVFGAYYRRWSQQLLRPVARMPRAIRLPSGLTKGTLPKPADICRGTTSNDVISGGETVGRRRALAWLRGPVGSYADASDGVAGHDDLAVDGTSRLSPYLHFGCISAVELVDRADRKHKGVPEFLRQLAWRDFNHQVLAARPDVTTIDYRTRHDRWRRDDEALQRWRNGLTGYPLVDAGMRQLAAQGWMHNRARLVTASFLTKHLYLDWRLGAQHFSDLLVDGDIANNCLNWQWVAGTGTDSRPNRVLNPMLQAKKYDARGAYVHRWLPEVDSPDYPPPMIDHAEAVGRFKAARGR
jgi:deoxyribodipyrimidine photo-lyase